MWTLFKFSSNFLFFCHVKLWFFFAFFYICDFQRNINRINVEKKRMNVVLTSSDEYNIIRFSAWCFNLCVNNDLCESVAEIATKKNEKQCIIVYINFIFVIVHVFRKLISIHFYWKWTYIVLVRIKIGWPKNAGTFSSINECVLIKFSVASGNVRESLWHEPGLGSGTC